MRKMPTRSCEATVVRWRWMASEARVIAVENHDVPAPAVRVLEVQVRQRLPAATQADDLDIILAAAVGNGFYNRVEPWNIAAASEDADSLFCHDEPFTTLADSTFVGSLFGPQAPPQRQA